MSTPFRLLLPFLLILAACLAAPAAAADPDAGGDGRLLLTEDLTAERFPASAANLRRELHEGGYRSLSSAQKQRIGASLDAIQEELDGGRGNARTRIVRHQRRINELLLAPLSANSASSDVVCQRFKRVGSNIQETRCMTREQAEREREAARRMVSGVGAGCDPHVPTEAGCR